MNAPDAFAKRLLAASQAGLPLDLRVGNPWVDDAEVGWSWRASRTIAARSIIAVATRAGPARPRPRCVWLRGARISGELDLRHAEIQCPLILEGCYVDGPLSFSGARLPALRLSGTCAPSGIAADHIRVSSDLRADAVIVSNGFDLTSARIEGSLILDDGRLSDRSGPALSAEQIFVGGQLSCSGHFAAVGPLLLARARVTGPVAFGGRLESDHGDAIDAAGLKAESHVTFRASCAAEGRVVLLGASVGGNLRFIGGRLVNPHAVALSAAGAHVHGDLVVRDGLQVRGQLELTEATIGGQLLLGKAAVSDGPDPVVALDGATIDGAVFFDDGLLVRGHVAMRFAKVNGPVYVRSARVLNPGAVAISLDGLRAQGHVRLGPDLDVVGEIRGVRSSIAGQLNVTAILRNPHHLSMHFDGAQLGAHVRFAGVRSEGEIRLLGAHISGQFAIDDLCASKPQRACLSADRLTVDGDVYLSNITAAGEVRFPGARMLGQAMFSQVNIESNTETALSLRAATVDGDLGVGSARLGKGRLDLTDAAVGGELLDTDITWRGSYELEQLRYTRIDARNKLPVKKRKGRFWEDPIARRRLTWLTKNASGYHPQLYDQLARTYRSAGHDTRARRVLIQKERERRRSFGIPGRAWSLMQDLLLGYGYRTWLVLFPFVLLAGLGFAYFDAHRSLIVQLDPTHHPPPFRPLLYTLDLLLPVVTLGQRDNYSARHGAETMSAVLVICGWILTTAIVAGLAALVRRER